MRELIKICPKIQFFQLSAWLEKLKRECTNVSGTNWKSPLLIKPCENDHFSTLFYFPLVLPV